MRALKQSTDALDNARERATFAREVDCVHGLWRHESVGSIEQIEIVDERIDQLGRCTSIRLDSIGVGRDAGRQLASSSQQVAQATTAGASWR